MARRNKSHPDPLLGAIRADVNYCAEKAACDEARPVLFDAVCQTEPIWQICGDLWETAQNNH